MGRIEKAIVLTVLLGVILILGISMDLEGGGRAVPDVPPAGGGSDEIASRQDGGLDGSGPRRPDLDEQRGEGTDPALVLNTPGEAANRSDERPAVGPLGAPPASDGGLPADPVVPTTRPGGLLSSNVDTTPDPRSKNIPAGSALVTLEGLRPTSDDNLMRYRYSVGDNFVELAERFYGHADYSPLLLRSNEGHTYFAEGDEILVPVYDRLGLGRTQEPATEQPAQIAADGEYVVREGDSLWTISKKTLGKGSRWREIHAINLDRLPAADAVRPGMVLRIPTD